MNMKTEITYAESKGNEPFDWNLFLDDRIHERYLNSTSNEDAEIKAEQWVTCAVGNQCAAIPRRENGSNAPADEELFRLGVEFSGNIELRDWRTAQIILRRIETRSAEILAEMQHGKPAGEAGK